MQDKPVINVGVIGYGFMGRTHALAYQSAKDAGYPCRVIAIADSALQSLEQESEAAGNISTGEQKFDSSLVTLMQDAHALIERTDIDLVSICTHTDTHVDIAIAALRAGKHVLVEKPIAIDPDQIQRLADEAARSDRVCMPAMCMRYWPAWVKMNEMIRDERHGRVRSAEFHRMGSRPTWASEFYADETRSGGALYDLHIHDTDFILHCFGMPKSVSTSGDGLHLSTIYHYDNGPVHVLAQGAWDHQPSVGFRMRCTIVCERATIDFDISREDQLVVHCGDDSEAIEVGDLSGYDTEVRAILDRIFGHSNLPIATMQSALQVSRILEAERNSLLNGCMVTI